MIMMAMRLEKLRQVDLNLLITFAAIAEEKSVTAAASRLLLSQPAVSRALQRARALFQDDLLVQSPKGFELTLRGRKILMSWRDCCPKWNTWSRPQPSIQCGRRATSTFLALTMFVRSCSRIYAGNMRMGAIA